MSWRDTITDVSESEAVETVEVPQDADLVVAQPQVKEEKLPPKATSWKDTVRDATPDELGDPIVDKAEDDLYAEESAKREAQPEVSAWDAFMRGQGQGMTFDFGDEIAAGFEAAGQAVGVKGLGANNFDELGFTTPTALDETKDLYSTFKDRLEKQRAEIAAAQEQHPGTYTSGALTGGLMSPGLGAIKASKGIKSGLDALTKTGALKNASNLTKTIVKHGGKIIGNAGVGAGTGMVAGMGMAEGDLAERAEQALPAAEMGAYVSGGLSALGTAGTAINQARKAAAEIPVVKGTVEAFKRGLKGEKLTGAGRRLAADKLRETSGDFLDDVNATTANINRKIGNELSEATAQGKQIDLTQEVDETLTKLNELVKDGIPEEAAFAQKMINQIKKITGIKDQAKKLDDGKLYGVDKADLPEGLIVPKPQQVSTQAQKVILTPEEAQKLKLVLGDSTQNQIKTSLNRDPLEVADALRRTTRGAIEDSAEAMKHLNKTHGDIQDLLNRVNIDTNDLRGQNIDKVQSALRKLDAENDAGDLSRAKINEIIGYLREANPRLAAKYEKEFLDVAERIQLANEIHSGLNSISVFGTTSALSKAAGNVAGRLTPQAVAGGAALGGRISSAVAKNPLTQHALTKTAIQGAGEGEVPMLEFKYGQGVIKEQLEPHMLRKKVAETAEKADPELLKSQAQAIRTQFGEQGEKLATILDRMADKDKDARRALMFTVLQNQAYRKMLGLREDENTR